MPTITTKRKVSIWAYVLIFLLIAVVIALAVLHIVGVVDLSFVGTGFMDLLTWAQTDAVNGALLLGGVFVGGALTHYTLTTYLVGRQVPVPGYAPIGQTISEPQQQKDEVVVNE